MIGRRGPVAVGSQLVALLVAGRALAGGGDYRLDSRDWNGLGRLADEARAVGCTISASDTLDWSTLESTDAVWFVYPRTAVDGGRLRRFLEAGGRAVIADDFGAADAALSALEIRRLRGELPDIARYDDNPALPVAHQAMATELSVGVPSLVANHPAFFSAATPATYAFAPGAALVVEGRLGKGYFVALADPSVLINNMLEIEDDLAFARALLRRTCKPGERVRLVTQSFVERGEPSGELAVTPGDSPFLRFNRMLEAIDEAARHATDGRGLGLLAILAAVTALVLYARAWPARSQIEGQWTRAPSPPEAGWQALVDRYAAPMVSWGWALPAARLRDEVVTRLSDSLGGAVADWTPAELRWHVERVHGPRAAALAFELWRKLRRLGGPAAGGEPWVTRRQLARLHRGARALFDVLAERGQGNH